MRVSRTDDLRFADWLGRRVAGEQDHLYGFDQFAQIPVEPEGDLSLATLSALIGHLKSGTPHHLHAEVTYGIWAGHPGLWGQAIDGPSISPGGGPLTRSTLRAAAMGVRMSAHTALRQASRREWWDDLLHKRLSLTGRQYLLFRGPLAAVTRWDRDSGKIAFRHSPDLIWPDDHSWLVMSHPETHTVTVSGSGRLAALIESDPTIATAPRRSAG
jgi:hypothetical protein